MRMRMRMKMDKGLLNPDGTITICNNIVEWAKSFESMNRAIKQDSVGDVKISTVFLGINMGWVQYDPKWFETMIFGGKHNLWQARHPTIQAAIASHERILENIKSGRDPWI
jgi:hypothetical protein